MNAKYNGWQVELSEAKAELQAREELIAELVEALENYAAICMDDTCRKPSCMSTCAKEALDRAKEVMKG